MDRESPDQSPAHRTTDDESLTTTSTDSDTFDTWTLVTDKKTANSAAAKPAPAANTERVEILSQRSDEERQEEQASASSDNAENPIDSHTSELDTSHDELSDGISVISESENGDRLTPHPFLQSHLGDLNLKFSAGEAFDSLLLPKDDLIPGNVTVLPYAEDLELLDEPVVRQRRHLRRSRSRSTDKTLAETSNAVAAPALPPIVRRGLTGLFYVSVALALLAFIGKIRYPEWEPLAATKPIESLTQKLSEMELQNNLMRAEIDLLSKQVTYLNSLKDANTGQRGRMENPPPQQRPNKNAFKAWPGNGESLEPVIITKADLKRPYQCRDGRFVEIAGMCVENVQEKPPLLDQLGDAVQDALHQSETYRKFEKMNDEIHAFIENPFDGEIKATPVETGTSESEQELPVIQGSEAKIQEPEVRVDRKPKTFGGSSKEREQRYETQQNRHYKQRGENDSKEHYNKNKFAEKERGSHEKRRNSKEQHDDSKEWPQQQRGNKKSHDSNESKERYKRKNSKERLRRDDSKERLRRDDSEERTEQSRRNSKEHFERRRKPEFADGPKNGGQWQEQLMRHREQARREHEHQRNDKNWYMERGDSREQMRHGHTYKTLRNR